MRPPAVYVIAALTILVLGLNWPIMAAGVTAIPPLWMTTVRLLGAACLVAAALATVGGLQRPSRGDYPILASVSLFRLALVTTLILTALERVPPGRSSILVYTSSLWAMPMAGVFLRERLGGLRIAGVLSGCLGILLLVQPWSLDWSLGSTATGYAMLLTAAVASAACTVHIRGHRWLRTELELMPWAFAAAGTVTGLLALLVEGAPGARWSLTLVAIMALPGGARLGLRLLGRPDGEPQPAGGLHQPHPDGRARGRTRLLCAAERRVAHRAGGRQPPAHPRRRRGGHPVGPAQRALTARVSGP